jgi:hypothetical protein
MTASNVLTWLKRQTDKGGDPLGDLVFWELNSAAVERSELERLWATSGLPGDLLPEPPTPEKALKVATREAQVGHPDRLLRVAKEDDREIVVGVVREERDGVGGLQYHQEARVTLDRPAGVISTDNPTHEIVCAVEERFRVLRTVHTSDDIRRTITRTLATLASVTLKSSGGVYWIPAPYAEHLRRLQAVIERLGASRFCLVPISRTVEGEAALAHAAKSSIEEELAELQTEIQQFVATPPDRVSTLQRRLEMFDELRRRADLYQTVLRAQVTGLADSLAGMTVAVEGLLAGRIARAA